MPLGANLANSIGGCRGNKVREVEVWAVGSIDVACSRSQFFRVRFQFDDDVEPASRNFHCDQPGAAGDAGNQRNGYDLRDLDE